MPMRTFHLARTEDATGVSGTGTVAQGVVFDDGRVALRWIVGPHRSTVAYDSIEAVEAIHGHEGRTRIIFEPETATTVYIVTSGSYSDYSIDAIFDNRETADLYAGGAGTSREVEEYELNTIAAVEAMYWQAIVGCDEVITVCNGPELFTRHPDPPHVQRKLVWNRTPEGGTAQKQCWQGTAYGRSPEHARKNLSDALAAAKAAEAGLA